MPKKLFHELKTSEDTLARVGRNSAWLFSGKGVSAVLSLFYLAIVTRTLGPSSFGTFILIISTGQILAALLRVQTWQAVVQFGNPALQHNNKAAFASIVRKALSIEAVGGISACLLLYTLLPQVAARFDLGGEIESGLLVYGSMIFLAIRSTPTGILRAHDRFRDGAIGDVAIPVTRMVGAIVVLAIGPSMIGFLVVWGFSELLCTLALWLLVARGDARKKPIAAVKPAGGQPERGFFRFLIATNFSYLLTVVREQFVVIVVGLFVGTAAAGLFRLADQLANSINRLTETFSRPIFTELSKLYGQGNYTELSRLFFRSLRISLLSGVGMFALLVLIGKPVIHLMSGEAFLDAYPLLLILAGATIIGLIGVGLEPLLQAADKAGAAFVPRLVSLVILAGLLFIFMPTYGAKGAAAAMLISAVITVVLLLWLSWSLLGRLKDHR